MLLSRSGICVSVTNRVVSGLELGTVAMAVDGRGVTTNWHVGRDVLVTKDVDSAAALGGAPDLALGVTTLVLSCCQFTVTR